MERFAGSLSMLMWANPFLAYPLLFFGVIFLGNIVSFTALWIAFRSGEWRMFAIVIPLILAADIAGDLSWYGLGRFLRDTRLGGWIRVHLPRHEKIERGIKEKNARWIMLSKFIPSTTFPIIFLVGWARVPFKKFIPYSLLAIVSALPLLLGISYGLAAGLGILEAIAFFKHAEYLLAIGIILFFLLDYVLTGIIGALFDKE